MNNVRLDIKTMSVSNGFRILGMNFKIKLLELSNGDNCLVVIAGGPVDAQGFKEIFREVAKTSRMRPKSKVLIDLEDAKLIVEPSDIRVIVNGLGLDLPSFDMKIALVSSAEPNDAQRLRGMSDALVRMGLTVALCTDVKNAAAWLGDNL
jgi:hypothetical protein